MLNPETARVLAEADRVLAEVNLLEALVMLAAAALAVLAFNVLKAAMKPAKKQRVFRELF